MVGGLARQRPPRDPESRPQATVNDIAAAAVQSIVPKSRTHHARTTVEPASDSARLRGQAADHRQSARRGRVARHRHGRAPRPTQGSRGRDPPLRRFDHPIRGPSDRHLPDHELGGSTPRGRVVFDELRVHLVQDLRKNHTTSLDQRQLDLGKGEFESKSVASPAQVRRLARVALHHRRQIKRRRGLLVLSEWRRRPSHCRAHADLNEQRPA